MSESIIDTLSTKTRGLVQEIDTAFADGKINTPQLMALRAVMFSPVTNSVRLPVQPGDVQAWADMYVKTDPSGKAAIQEALAYWLDGVAWYVTQLVRNGSITQDEAGEICRGATRRLRAFYTRSDPNATYRLVETEESE